MKLGFIGTGTITEAIVTGLMRADYPVEEIVVSARGEAISARLSSRYEKVSVRTDNQAIVDAADVIFLAVRPQVAQAVIPSLRFPPNKELISLIATLPVATLREWVGPSIPITRAIPLPSVSELKGVTAVLPESEMAANLFSALGTSVVTNSIDEFDAYAVASAMMGTYFGLLDASADWMRGRGVPPADARSYLSSLFHGLASAAVQSTGASFSDLRLGHSTPGGLNQQHFDVFVENGGVAALTSALDSVIMRVQRTSSASSTAGKAQKIV